MLRLEWDDKGIIYWKILELKQTNNDQFFCQHLDRRSTAFWPKRTSLLIVKITALKPGKCCCYHASKVDGRFLPHLSFLLTWLLLIVSRFAEFLRSDNLWWYVDCAKCCTIVRLQTLDHLIPDGVPLLP